MGASPSNPDVVYFLGYCPGYGNNDHLLWRYTYLSGTGQGAGGLWEDLSHHLPQGEYYNWEFNAQRGYNLAVAVKPDDEDVVFIGAINLWRTTDGFQSEANFSKFGGYFDGRHLPNHHVDQHYLFFSPSDPNRLYNSNDGGVFVTPDCLSEPDSWIPLNNGYFTTQFYTIALDHAANGDNLIVGGMQDNNTFLVDAANPYAEWYEILGGDGSYCAIADYKSFICASWQRGNVMRLDNVNNNIGEYWAYLTPEGADGFLFINPFLLDPHDNRIMYLAAGEYVWRNSDITQIPRYLEEPTTVNWTQLLNSVVPESKVTALDISTSPPNILYYGTQDGQVYRIDNADTGDPIPVDVWRSKGFPEGAYVSCITVDPTDADHALVVFSNYSVKSIFATEGGGTEWSHVSGNLEQIFDGSGDGPSVRWVEILNLDTSRIYFAGTSTGLYSTTVLDDRRTVWQHEGSMTIGNVVVDMLDARASDGLVVAGTHGAGVFSATFAEGDRPYPEIFVLEQNYPNPFNAETTILFNLADASSVRLSVYDTKGRRVRSLIDGTTWGTGGHSVIWDGLDDDGKGCPSGLYFYTMEAGEESATGRMILMR